MNDSVDVWCVLEEKEVQHRIESFNGFEAGEGSGERKQVKMVGTCSNKRSWMTGCGNVWTMR